jgi:hypothetical protein
MDVTPAGTVQLVVPVAVKIRSHTSVVPVTSEKPLGQMLAIAGGIEFEVKSDNIIPETKTPRSARTRFLFTE